MRTPEPEPLFDGSVIEEARKKIAAGDFKRTIVKRVPDDLSYDRFYLNCGHSFVWAVRLVKEIENLTEWDCNRCADEWMRNAQGGGKT
jgi:hypothetical protein